MKTSNSLIKKFLVVLIFALLLMYIITGRSFANNAINLDSLETIEIVTTSEEPAAEGNNVVEIENNINQTNNVVVNTPVTTNSSVTNKSALPDTGSNTEIIFIIGITALAGTAIYVRKKSKIK